MSAHTAGNSSGQPPRPTASASTSRRSRGLSGRPEMYTSYEQNMRMLNTKPKRRGVFGLAILAAALTMLVDDATLQILALGFAAAIGAIGLNLVTGYCGQVSLGHAFFLAVGAYTAAALSGDPEGRTIGFDVTNILIWLPAAGLAAGLAGVIIAPLATRLRGLYLAIVTLGLVFLGEHIFTEWRELTGGADVGREAAVPELFGFSFADDGDIFTGDQKVYLLTLVLLIIFAVLARNLTRSKVGRAFNAIRDRDMAAASMGVRLARYKTIAFGLSSFYAGVGGALLYMVTGFFNPASFDLLLSIEFIAMILIGGIGTISGSIMGAMFITLLDPVVRALPEYIPLLTADTSAIFNVFVLEGVLYGALIIGFLLFEPRGLFGIWLRIRNYWKAWPFTY